MRLFSCVLSAFYQVSQHIHVKEEKTCMKNMMAQNTFNVNTINTVYTRVMNDPNF